MQQIKCVSHGCILWQGEHLQAADIRALAAVHAIQHANKPVTVDDILPNAPEETPDVDD